MVGKKISTPPIFNDMKFIKQNLYGKRKNR